MSLRRELSKEVQTRLNAGESKSTIYTALKGKYRAGAVERSLAQWPYPADKARNRFLNYPLMIIAVFFTLLKTLQLIAVFQTLEAGQKTAFLPAAALPILICCFIIYGLANYNLIGYLLIILLGIQNLFNIVTAGAMSPQIIMLLAFSVAAIVLAVLQKRKLFPNTSWLMRHQKDADGSPLF